MRPKQFFRAPPTAGIRHLPQQTAFVYLCRAIQSGTNHDLKKKFPQDGEIKTLTNLHLMTKTLCDVSLFLIVPIPSGSGIP